MTKLNLNNLTREEKIQLIKKGYDKSVEFADKKMEILSSEENVSEVDRESIKTIYQMTMDSLNASVNSLTETLMEVETASLEELFLAQALAMKELYFEEKDSLSKLETKGLSLFCAGHFEVILNSSEYIIDSGKYEYDEDLEMVHDLTVMLKEFITKDSMGKSPIDSLKGLASKSNIEKLKEMLADSGLDIADLSEISKEEVEAKLKQAGKDVKVVEVTVDEETASDRDKLNELLMKAVKKAVKEDRDAKKKNNVRESVRESIKEEIDKAKNNEEENSGLSFGDKVIKAYEENITAIKANAKRK